MAVLQLVEKGKIKLAFIIEKVSGMKYCDYVKKNIFDKCGMTKTTSMATGDLTYTPVNYDDLVKCPSVT